MFNCEGAYCTLTLILFFMARNNKSKDGRKGSSVSTRQGGSYSLGRVIHFGDSLQGRERRPNDIDSLYNESNGRTSFTEPISESSELKAQLNDTLFNLSNSRNAYDQILASIGNNGELNPYIAELLGISKDQIGKLGTNYSDFQQTLINMILDNITKNEQRSYDEKALQEQRLYDNPTNQLLRLMATGMSRDAAIQALQGSSDAPLVGSGADVESGASKMPSSSEQIFQGLQTGASIISAVGGMVSLGFSAAQAVQQVHYLKNANFLSDSQNRSYKLAGNAYSILSAAGAAADTFDSVASASSAISKLAESGDLMAQQFVNSGRLAEMQQLSPFASNVLKDMYMAEHGSDMFRKEMRRIDLENDLTNAKIETEYQNVMDSLQRILESDERIKSIRQDVLIKKAQVRQENYAADYAEFQSDILERLRSISDSEGNDVIDLMSMSQFSEIWMNMEESVSKTRDPEKFREFLNDNWSVAADLAAINAVYSSNYRANLGGKNDDPSLIGVIMRFGKMLSDSGISEDLRAVGAIGAKVISSFLTPVKFTD